MSETLDLSNYTLEVEEDFSDPDLHPTFDVQWGKPENFSVWDGEAHLESSASEGWPNTGLIQGPWGADAGQGYGVYEMTARLEDDQGGGAALLLWPATNRWPGPEVDLLESSDTTRDSGYWTLHWEENGQDRFDWNPFSLDLTQEHTYAVKWEPGRLTYYIDGNLIESVTENVPVPFEDGGENLVMGIQVSDAGKWNQPGDVVRLHVERVAYYAPVESWDPDSAVSYPVESAWVPEAWPVEPTGWSDGAVDWDAIAAREVAWFDANGWWGAPPDWSGAGDPAQDWDAVAAQVTANFESTGFWF